jgi:Cellulose binding domain
MNLRGMRSMILRGLQRSKGQKQWNVRRTWSSLEEMEPRELLSSATFALTSDWGTGFGGQVTIANTGSTPVTNWSLSFNWDRSITQIWNGTISSHVGNQYVITNAGWNATIAPGGTVAFGFDGRAGNVGSDVPTNYALDGVPLGASTPPGLSINNVTVNDGTAGATAAFTVTLS